MAVLRAARKQVRAVNSSFQINKTTLYEVLQAQQELADAETRYYRTVIDYNLSIVNLNYRKGSLLEYNGVTLAEGPWPNKAYFDSWRHARERDAGRYVNYAFTSPQVVSRGPYPQIQGTDPTVSQTSSSDFTLPTESSQGSTLPSYTPSPLPDLFRTEN